MKKNLKYIIAAGLLICMASCDSNLEPFETVGVTGAPAVIEPSAVKSEALPGQIKLTWEAPEGDFSYLKVRYNDPIQKKEITKLFSKGTTEWLIEDTRARFGDYTFYFQTFNAAHQGSEIKEVKAKSGVAPAITTETKRTKVTLTTDQLSTNAQEPKEGPIKNLIDGNNGTFFHTRWSDPLLPLPHYFQINFKEEHENFALFYKNRTDNTWTTDGRPSVVELQVSNDAQSWETVSTISGLPSQHSTEYTSGYIVAGRKFNYFRFNVIATTGNTSYFNLAEFVFYDVDLSVYDPETVPLD